MNKPLICMVVALCAVGARGADYTPTSKENSGGALGAEQVTLAEGKVIVGQSSGVGLAVTPSGGATMTTGGVVTVNLAHANTTGVVAVAKGGTGAVTLTGLVKGNGTSAMTAAAVGSDYLAPATDASVTNATLAVVRSDGGTSTLTIVKGVITKIE